MSGSLTFDEFLGLTEQLPELESVVLQGLGEPLLCPEIMSMVSEASRRGCRVGFNTNATLLTGSRARELIDAGVDWLCISLDGATAETYEGIRDGARFDRVTANIAGLMDVRRSLGMARPEVSIVFVAMRRNVDELPDVVRLAAAWGVDQVSVQNLSHDFSDATDDPGYVEIRSFTGGEALWADDPGPRAQAERAFAEAADVAEALGMRLNLPLVEERPTRRRPGEPGCDWPWREAYVTAKGQLQPCCMVMGTDRAVLGDLSHGTFAEAWHGEPLRTFRRALLSPHPPEVCQGCALYRGVF